MEPPSLPPYFIIKFSDMIEPRPIHFHVLKNSNFHHVLLACFTMMYDDCYTCISVMIFPVLVYEELASCIQGGLYTTCLLLRMTLYSKYSYLDVAMMLCLRLVQLGIYYSFNCLKLLLSLLWVRETGRRATRWRSSIQHGDKQERHRA